MNNILQLILKSLNVKYTKKYTEKLFTTHPNRDNLLGLSEMLSYYAIESHGLRFSNKRDLLSCGSLVPAVAHLHKGFALIDHISQKKIRYTIGGKQISSNPEEFYNIWSGVLLSIKRTQKSIEPDYKKHIVDETFSILKTFSFLVSIGIIVIFHSSFKDVPFIYLLLDCIGCFICVLLLQQTLHIKKRYGEKICSVFSHSGCGHVLESSAAKIFGRLHWSEIGLGFFLANIFISLFTTIPMQYFSIITICIIPYSVWSILYQLWTKKWCPLCVIVQIVIFVKVIIILLKGHVEINEINIIPFCIICSIYVIFIVGVNTYSNIVRMKSSSEQLQYQLNSIKSEEKIYNLLSPQKDITIGNASSLIIGNSDASLKITIFSNPYCNPCAKIHPSLDKLYRMKQDMSINYVFTCFDDSLIDINRILIASYFIHGPQYFWDLLGEWYKTKNKQKFIKKNHKDYDIVPVSNEIRLHEELKSYYNITYTPTILVNGKRLPKNYSLDDLLFVDFSSMVDRSETA